MFLFTGYVVASFWLWREARKEGLNEEKVIDLMLVATFSALLFGRIGYIIFNYSLFETDWGRWLLFLKYPGFSFLGVLLGSLGAVLIFGRTLRPIKRSLLAILDFFVIPGIIMMVFGNTAGYLLLALVLIFVRNKVKPGFSLGLFLLVVSFSNWILVKGAGGVLYYLWLVIGVLGFFITMIKFPANVLEQVKGYLEEKRRATEKRLMDLKEDPFEDKSRLLDNATDDAEAHQKEGHERTQAVMGQLSAILVQTRKALTKIKIGKYGICESCGKMIDTDRLAAMPSATLCMSCEKKRESK